MLRYAGLEARMHFPGRSWYGGRLLDATNHCTTRYKTHQHPLKVPFMLSARTPFSRGQRSLNRFPSFQQHASINALVDKHPCHRLHRPSIKYTEASAPLPEPSGQVRRSLDPQRHHTNHGHLLRFGVRYQCNLRRPSVSAVHRHRQQRHLGREEGLHMREPHLGARPPARVLPIRARVLRSLQECQL